jgi:hypothetical protein
MTIPERVHRLQIDHKPRRYCDDCICKERRLFLSREVAPVTKSLGLTARLGREKR